MRMLEWESSWQLAIAMSKSRRERRDNPAWFAYFNKLPEGLLPTQR
nr:hypothetical protein Q903MT_gene2484 [Picea sitchensis]